jgi:opacity protein-like surface antigen
MRPIDLVSSLTLALVLSASPITAQEFGAQEFGPPPRGYVGAELLVANPTGAFAENVGTGFGIGGFGRYALDEAGVLSLRADLGFVQYGRETIRICVTVPCRVTGDLTTENNIVFGGVGPELGVAGGPFRMYGNLSAGFAYFQTKSSVEGASNDGDPFASSTNFDDATFAWMAGGGVQIRVSSGRHPVDIDVGARYHGNGEAEYLRKGDIQDLPDGSVVIRPRRSETNLWTFRLGVSVGLRSGGDDEFEPRD